MDLDKKDVIEALRAYDDVRHLLATSNHDALTVEVLPPEHPPSQRDLRLLRLFFQVERDQTDRFALLSAENRYPVLAELAASVAGPVSERVLNVELPLRTRFIKEELVTTGRRARHPKGVVNQLLEAAERFGQVENARADAAREAYNEARLITQQGLSIIRDTLDQVASRQAMVRFLPSRQQVDEATSDVLCSFRRQAILTSQTAALQQLHNRIEEAEAVSATMRKRTLLIQTGGRMKTDRTNTMRRSISRLRSLSSTRGTVSTRVVPQFPDHREVFVDTPLLIGDADDILLSSASLLDSPTVPATGFRFGLFASRGDAGVQKRSSAVNAATDLIEAVYPTLFAPSPTRNLRARNPAPEKTGSALEKRLTSLLSDLAGEAAATPDTLDETEIIRQATDLEIMQFRELSKLRKSELRTISSMLQDYEQEVPVMATGLSDSAIFDAGCALLLAQEPMKPFFVGIRPNNLPEAEFTETIEALFEGIGCQEGHLVFLGNPDETWKNLESKWLASYRPRLTIHTPKQASDMRRMATFMPFIIGTAGCLLASGGITAQVLVAPRRKDKTHVGVELRGRGCQAAPLQMLQHLLQQSPQEIAQVEDFHVDPRSEDGGLLSSTLYRRWLQCTTMPENNPPQLDATTNLGAAVLVDRFRDEPKLYQKCLDDFEIDR